MSRPTAPPTTSVVPVADAVSRRGHTLRMAAVLLLVLAVFGWLGWAVFRDFWVLVIACIQP